MMTPSRPRSALVVTVVHDPRDSRIWFRQIDALLERGWRVTYAAPFSAQTTPPTEHLDGTCLDRLRFITLPRARGRHRLHAALGVRRLLRQVASHHDVTLLHDPELLVPTVGLRLSNLVWDVHEDTAAALQQKQWLPAPFRPAVTIAVHQAERWAERHARLILAEGSYQQRFQRPHVVVPNSVVVPEEVSPVGHDRVVYLGSLTPARGSDLLPRIGRGLRERSGGRVTLEVIGPTYEDRTTRLMRDADTVGDLVWRGFLPADHALQRVRGALAGLSLLSDLPNFRRSMPTKVLEYCAYGVPVISTPLPSAADLVRRSGAGIVVPWNDPEAVVEAAMALRNDPARAEELARRGRQVADREFDWRRWSEVFTDELEMIAGGRHPTASASGGKKS